MLSTSLGAGGLNFFDPGQKQTDQSQYLADFVAQFGKKVAHLERQNELYAHPVLRITTEKQCPR